MKVLICGVIAVSLAIPLYADAVGISASPSRLLLSIERGEEITAQLIISNPSTNVSVFEVYPDEFESVIIIAPSSFILEGGDQKKVRVRIQPKKIGVFVTNISILAKPLAESAFSASAGIKIPVRLEVIGQRDFFAAALALLPIEVSFLGIFILAAVLFAFAFLLRGRRR